MIRAVIYARVSSQAQRDRHTIENQLRTLPAYIAAQGWTLVGTYVDDGRSASTGTLEARDGFARLVRDADAKLFDVVVVIDIDRLTRTEDIMERAQILAPFQRNNIQIVTPHGGALDLRTMLGELYVNLQALFAAEENRKRRARVIGGKARALADNRKPGGSTPYGLTYSTETGQWGIDETAAAIVREIFARVIAGDSCVTIAADLERRGVPPARHWWSRQSAWRLVRSRHTMGEWTADKRRRQVFRVPAIVDEATWQAANAKLQEIGKRGLVKTTHVYLIEGLAVCGACGSLIGIRSARVLTKGRGAGIGWTHATYICATRRDPKRARICEAPTVRTADLDEQVWAAVMVELDDPGLAAEIQRRAEQAAANRRDWAADVTGYRAHVTRLERVEGQLLARFRRDAISPAALDAELEALRRERTAVLSQLATAEQAARAAPESHEPDATAWLTRLRQLAANASPEERQGVIRAIVPPRGVTLVDGVARLTLLIRRGADEPATSLTVGVQTRRRIV